MQVAASVRDGRTRMRLVTDALGQNDDRVSEKRHPRWPGGDIGDGSAVTSAMARRWPRQRRRTSAMTTSVMTASAAAVPVGTQRSRDDSSGRDGDSPAVAGLGDALGGLVVALEELAVHHAAGPQPPRVDRSVKKVAGGGGSE
jgi:hypothetical protein